MPRKLEPGQKPKTKQIGVRVRPEVYDRLIKATTMSGYHVSIASILERGIDLVIADMQKRIQRKAK